MLPRIRRVDGDGVDYLLMSGNDAISSIIFKSGSYDSFLKDISEMFYTEVANPIVIDIGANLGAYSIPVAKDIEAQGGQVIGFEPQRIVYYQLCSNIFINRLENYIAYQQAVSDATGKIDIPELNYSNCNNIGAFSLDKNYRDRHGLENSVKAETLTVPVIKLDDLLVDKKVCIIKIDVEGYELNVLKGARNFLQRHEYPPFLFEAWDFEWFSNQKIELMEYVSSIGYEISSLNNFNFLAQHPNHYRKIEVINDGSVIKWRKLN